MAIKVSQISDTILIQFGQFLQESQINSQIVVV